MRHRVLLAAVAALFAVALNPLKALSATIWPSNTIPSLADSGPDSAVELGVKFRADRSGTVTGIRFYKGVGNTGTHVANLWTAGGSRLATATFSQETASGWQEVAFASPVAITANTVYVASYHTNTGHYSADVNFFAGKGAGSTPLFALADGTSGANGVYAYGASSRFPSSGWRSCNYWVDVVFTPTAGSDSTAPTVSSFTVPATSSSLTVAISSFSATDNVAVTGYLVTESATAPAASGSGWTATAPTSYTFTTAGSKTLYGWAKDAAGNVSTSRSASVTVTLLDATKPTVTAFTVPATATTLSVPITSFTATDNVGVTGYLITESATAPSASATGWTSTPPASYTFTTAGSKTLYAWAKDAAGNVSSSRTAGVTVTLSATGLEPAGWYAGDMHVHRSCGGSPETVSAMFQKMSNQNLSIISLLADMGNAEVQNAATDLPLVNGSNASVSTSNRILHWDAEWHWDAIYNQYAHQALGGHIVALGLSHAEQVWQEYTYPIFQWAHQQNGIAGFAHMQYLDNTIPQNLTCCTPMEYPVEVALGASDFISEDVYQSGGNYGYLNADAPIQAYYRLLNCGFRPGLAAGTDYPCTDGSPLGSLLTYAQAGQLTYRNWIDAIAAGRTVVSRNGHREFLALTVNGSATPGDEIRLSVGGPVPVTIQWTANQSFSGTIELVQNGVVVASKQTSVAQGAPATLNATVDFSRSGWLAARRMGNDGHQVHTGAVFVLVDGAPIRTSAEDAQFYVQWIDNLLAKTSPGGAWNYLFKNNLSEAQARYRAAKAVFQQIQSEAEGGSTPPPTQSSGIFTNQTPGVFDNDASYELGTRFYADVAGQITQVRIYTNATEGGTHTVRIWRVQGSTLVAGPYSWNIASGTPGWRSFTLPAPLAISANTDYIVSVSNSSDQIYASQVGGFNQPIVNGHLHTYTGSGVYAEQLGVMPTQIWNNSNYFRDVVFAP